MTTKQALTLRAKRVEHILTNNGTVKTELVIALLADMRQFIESAGADSLDIRLNDGGALDEIVGAGTFHLEQMDANHWWMLLTDANGNAVHVHLTARGAIKANFEREHHAARSPQPGDGT